MKRYASLLPLALLLSCASTERPVAESPAVSTVPPVAVVNRAFDVPALLGLNADEIARPLISQSVRPDRDRTPRQSETGTTEALYTYWRDTTALEVSYDPASCKQLLYQDEKWAYRRLLHAAEIGQREQIRQAHAHRAHRLGR